MNHKGQLFSLDFLFSVIVVVFAVGIVLNTAQFKSFAGMQDAEMNKIRQMGDLASDMLVNGPHICDLVSIGGTPTDLGNLNNCLSTNASKQITKGALGLTDDYGCSIELRYIIDYDYGGVDHRAGIAANILNCDDSFPDDRQIYSSSRLVVVSNLAAINKAQLADCMSGSCGAVLRPYNLVISVWEV